MAAISEPMAKVIRLSDYRREGKPDPDPPPSSPPAMPVYEAGHFDPFSWAA